VALESSTVSPFPVAMLPNFRSASVSWRNTLPAVPANVPCIASSRSSGSESVWARVRTSRSMSSR
jgi:hypothetical protein